MGTNVLEDIAASSIKVEVTSVSMQLLPLVAFSNYISRRLTNLQRSGICAYKIHQAATPQRIYGQECPLQKFLPNHIFFFAEYAINGANMRRCYIEFSNIQNIANNGIISEYDASIVEQR